MLHLVHLIVLSVAWGAPATSTFTSTATVTDTATRTSTNTDTSTFTATATQTATNTATATSSATQTATSTRTSTATRTSSITMTFTFTFTFTPTATATRTFTRTSTPSRTITNTGTPSGQRIKLQQIEGFGTPMAGLPATTNLLGLSIFMASPETVFTFYIEDAAFIAVAATYTRTTINYPIRVLSIDIFAITPSAGGAPAGDTFRWDDGLGNFVDATLPKAAAYSSTVIGVSPSFGPSLNPVSLLRQASTTVTPPKKVTVVIHVQRD